MSVLYIASQKFEMTQGCIYLIKNTVKISKIVKYYYITIEHILTYNIV